MGDSIKCKMKLVGIVKVILNTKEGAVDVGLRAYNRKLLRKGKTIQNIIFINNNKILLVYDEYSELIKFNDGNYTASIKQFNSKDYKAGIASLLPADDYGEDKITSVQYDSEKLVYPSDLGKLCGVMADEVTAINNVAITRKFGLIASTEKGVKEVRTTTTAEGSMYTDGTYFYNQYGYRVTPDGMEKERER